MKTEPLSLTNKMLTTLCKKDVIGCGAIFCLALLVRAFYLAEDAHSPFFHYFLLDAKQYEILAMQFAAGEWPPSEAFFWPPLYSIFMGSLFSLFGESIEIVKFVQITLGSLSCVWVYCISRTLGFSRTVSGGAAALCVFGGPLIYFDCQPLSVNLEIFISLGTIFLLLTARRERNWVLFVATGMSLGLAIIIRGSALLWIPVIIGSLVFYTEPHTTVPAFKSRMLHIVLILSAAFIVVSPVIWHNAKYDLLPAENEDQYDVATTPVENFVSIMKGEFCFPGYAGGINLYLGNVPLHARVNHIDNDLFFQRYDLLVQQAMKVGVATASQSNKYFVDKTVKYIGDSPLSWGALMLEKAADLFNGKEIPRVTRIYSHRKYSKLFSLLLWKRLIAFPSGVVYPLALFAIVVMWRERKRHWVIWGIAAMHAAFVVTFFVTARYRLLLYPLLSIYAANGVAQIFMMFKTKQKRLVLLLLPIFLVLCNWNVGSMSDIHGAFEYYNLANSLYRDGRIDDASSAYRELLKHYPEHESGHYNFGYLLLNENRTQEAMHHFNEAIRLNPKHGAAYGNLANCYLATGDRGAAISLYRRALQIDSSLQWVRDNLDRLKEGNSSFSDKP